MSYVSAEFKLRRLASLDVTLQGYFGDSSDPADDTRFRWFDTQLPQGQISVGACVVVRRVSTVREYSLQGIWNISEPRFQIDVLAPNTTAGQADPETGRAAAAAVIDFLGTISLNIDPPFFSSPSNFPNFVLNQRAGLYYQLAPPCYVQSIDIRAYNLEELAAP